MVGTIPGRNDPAAVVPRIRRHVRHSLGAGGMAARALSWNEEALGEEKEEDLAPTGRSKLRRIRLSPPYRGNGGKGR